MYQFLCLLRCLLSLCSQWIQIVLSILTLVFGISVTAFASENRGRFDGNSDYRDPSALLGTGIWCAPFVSDVFCSTSVILLTKQILV